MKRSYITLALRIALGLLLVYFGFFNITTPDTYSSYIPAFLTEYFEASVLMQLNGIIEIIFGLLLLGGLYRMAVSVLVGLHVLGIAVLVWPADISIRDFALAITAFTLACMDDDKYSLDEKWRKQIIQHKT